MKPNYFRPLIQHKGGGGVAAKICTRVECIVRGDLRVNIKYQMLSYGH